MRLIDSPFRSAIVAALAVAVMGTSGCSFFRKKNDLYAMSPESRPLEVPPDLTLPDTSGAMKMAPGAAPASVSRSSVGTPASASSVPAGGFSVPGDSDAIFTKVSDTLAATQGVTVASKAQILGTFDVEYLGSKFLLRVTKVDAGATVSAVDARGVAATGDGPTKLLEILKSALGG